MFPTPPQAVRPRARRSRALPERRPPGLGAPDSRLRVGGGPRFVVTLRRAAQFVTSPAAPIATGCSDPSPGGICTH